MLADSYVDRHARVYRGIECDDCGETFDGLDAFTDHLEECGR